MYREELTEIAKVIWESIVGLPLEPSESGQQAAAADLVTVRVNVSGAWNGSVSATFSRNLGSMIASAMLQLDAEQLSSADVSDALLEVVNMLGGNFKALLPPVCHLSLPDLVTDPSQVPGTLEETAHFVCEHQPLDICVRKLSLAS
ncbi:MAG TPA: chemotaxis protein CheX [Polyangiaceae bacterium]|nr:chemotaxis protein CheX [Polyangiaceae bacterium]